MSTFIIITNSGNTIFCNLMLSNIEPAYKIRRNFLMSVNIKPLIFVILITLVHYWVTFSRMKLNYQTEYIWFVDYAIYICTSIYKLINRKIFISHKWVQQMVYHIFKWNFEKTFSVFIAMCKTISALILSNLLWCMSQEVWCCIDTT